MTGEFAAIEAISARLGYSPPEGDTWIGDDAAVVARSGGELTLLTVDSVVEGVHADLSLCSLEDFGWKAVQAATSDVAAMGGTPLWALVSVAVPPGTDLDGLYEGIAEASRHLSLPVVGGDLVASEVLVVTVTVVGGCDGTPVLRSGALAGDELWVSGPLGASAAGLRLLRKAGPSTRQGRQSLVGSHRRPVALVEDGQKARRAGARAMIDVSDGFSADLDRLARASQVGVQLEEVPVAPGATLEEALSGGEDYQLIFALAPGAIGDSVVPRGWSRIGVCSADPEERTLAGRPLPPQGWEHRW